MAGKPYIALRKRTAVQTTLFDFTFDVPEGKKGEIIYVNSLAFYDLMPKYVFNSRYTKLRSGSEKYKTLDKASCDFTLYGKRYTNIITPARITRTERKGGVVKTYDIDLFPGKREQVIEWAVRIAAKRGSGTKFLDSHAGAEFTLYQLQQVCAELGHRMSYAQIREGLMVGMMCNIQTVCENDGDTFTANSAIFPFGAIQERQGSGSTATRTYVAFHPFVTAGITKIEFRQIDIKKATDYPGCIDRWLHMKLMHDYRYVDGSPLGPVFNLNASTIIACSGAGPFRRKRAGFEAVREALKRLENGGDIEPNPEERPHYNSRGRVEDITFNIRGTRAFAKMMKASLAVKNILENKSAQLLKRREVNLQE